MYISLLPSQTHISMKERKASLSSLNRKFEPLSIPERIEALYQYIEEKEVLVTSSFGTTSAFLLHQISQIRPTQPIHFINTRYLFAETVGYKDQLAEEFGLTVVEIQPHAGSHELTLEEQTWSTDPNLCCTVNKVLPLEEVKSRHTVWMSGLMGHQNAYRKGLKIFEESNGMIKFSPLLDFPKAEVQAYFEQHNLPRHPLESQGYGSIGCTHCTKKGKGREGRWMGSQKTECGIHVVQQSYPSAARS